MATELILIRHGETEWNALGRMQGHLTVFLNERGQQQAEAVATRLEHEALDALYSSDLDRTMQTAEAIAKVTGHQIETDARLREWNLGVLAGLIHSDAEAQYPEAYAIYREGRVDDLIPEGESIRDRFARVVESIEAIAAKHDGKRVVVVTHGGPLGDCYRRATGLALEQLLDVELYNGGLNTFVIDGSDWELKSWGDIDHLKEIGSLGDWEGRK